MSQAEVLPSPNILFLNKEELEKVNDHVDELMEANDIDGLAKMIEVYPLSADTLDSLKRYFGLNTLIANKINLANAIEKYGEDWLKS